ncbi:MAG: hypothetical protein RIS64_937 [Bacteroidota bacterium]|jgi:phosphate-selective porin
MKSFCTRLVISLIIASSCTQSSIAQIESHQKRVDSLAPAQPKTELPATPAPVAAAHAKKWYETFSIRGYAQVRYNRLFETNPKLKCDQCDKSIGENGGFFIRRARLILSGNVHDRVFFYIQPDLASAPSSTTNNFAQLRDLYFDVALDAKKEYRLRIGQSKIPFGFENLQSSQNRLPLDRADPTNSAVANERDLGVVFYYAPAKTRELFAKLVSDGLKGSGDYGVLGLGAYNGQTANKTESNNTPHVVARLAYPFELKNGQIMELGIQGYKGKYNLNADLRNVGVKLPSTAEFLDERVAATFIIYPKPYGIFAEFNTGNGPEFDKASDSIQVKKLTGGYIMATYRAVVGNQGQVLMPYIRYQWYRGGKKQEMDARSYQLEEWEMGIEWQVYKNFELTAAYTISERRFEDFKVQENLQRGSLLRLQAQLNF